MNATDFAKMREAVLHKDRHTQAQHYEHVETLVRELSDEPGHADADLRDRVLHRWRFKPEEQNAILAELLATVEKRVAG